jgi:hypothetical protein
MDFALCLTLTKAQRRQHKITFVFCILCFIFCIFVFYILYFCVLYFVFLCFIFCIFVFYILYFCVLYFVFLCFIFCIFVFYILYFCLLYFVFYILYYIFCILYFCVIIMFSDVGLYRHLVIQIVIFNNNVKTWLQAIEKLYFDCAKCVLHILNACLKSIIARSLLRYAYRIRHADISIAPVIRLGSDGDICIFKRFISYGTSSATDLEFRRRSSWSVVLINRCITGSAHEKVRHLNRV